MKFHEPVHPLSSFNASNRQPSTPQQKKKKKKLNLLTAVTIRANTSTPTPTPMATSLEVEPSSAGGDVSDTVDWDEGMLADDDVDDIKVVVVEVVVVPSIK